MAIVLHWLIFLVVGLCAGLLASVLVKGKRLSLGWSLLIGVVGALLGGALFRLLGFAGYGLIAQLIMATVGAVLLLLLVRKMR